MGWYVEAYGLIGSDSSFHFCSPSAGFSFYESEAAFKLCPHSPSQQKGLSSYFNAIDFESTLRSVWDQQYSRMKWGIRTDKSSNRTANPLNKMNAIISSLHHFEHFVLNHPKIRPIRRSAEKVVTLLIPFVFRAAVVRSGKIGMTVVVLVAFICDGKVIAISSSVDWPPVNIIPNCLLFFSLNERHFFPEFELQQERTARRIGDGFTI